MCDGGVREVPARDLSRGELQAVRHRALMILTRLAGSRRAEALTAVCPNRAGSVQLSRSEEMADMSSIIKQARPEVDHGRDSGALPGTRGSLIPTFRQLRHPRADPARSRRAAQGRRALGCEPGEPLPHHVEERRRDRALRRGELSGNPARHHRREGPDRSGSTGKYLSDRGAQGRRGVWLPRAASRERRVRSARATRRSGRPRATIAAAARSTVRCWIARPSRSCRKTCRGNGLTG